ncbi:MAG: hypothetical protein VX346_18795 [Planctomycetota bacterium]|nr:hypothetical protein [Planctomycetota bacterium]
MLMDPLLCHALGSFILGARLLGDKRQMIGTWLEQAGSSGQQGGEYADRVTAASHVLLPGLDGIEIGDCREFRGGRGAGQRADRHQATHGCADTD